MANTQKPAKGQQPNSATPAQPPAVPPPAQEANAKGKRQDYLAEMEDVANDGNRLVVRINSVDTKGNELATGSATYGNCHIRGVTIKDSAKGPFFSMPTYSYQVQGEAASPGVQAKPKREYVDYCYLFGPGDQAKLANLGMQAYSKALQVQLERDTQRSKEMQNRIATGVAPPEQTAQSGGQEQEAPNPFPGPGHNPGSHMAM